MLRASTVRERKARYPRGTVVRLESWARSKESVAPGTLGVVQTVDDGGTLHTLWATGHTLGLLVSDTFQVQDLTAPIIDDLLHFARPGHTACLCGQERTVDDDKDFVRSVGFCATCLLVANEEARADAH